MIDRARGSAVVMPSGAHLEMDGVEGEGRADRSVSGFLILFFNV